MIQALGDSVDVGATVTLLSTVAPSCSAWFNRSTWDDRPPAGCLMRKVSKLYLLQIAGEGLQRARDFYVCVAQRVPWELATSSLGHHIGTRDNNS